MSGPKQGWWKLRGVVAIGMWLALTPTAVLHASEGQEDQKSIRKMCGACPEGYATTAITNAPEFCKDGEPTLVQCVPLGGNMLSVCGACPDGYSEVGHSNVPARCGSKDGGLMSQCQSQHMDSSLPDPTQGGVKCPPDCGNTAAPGQGAVAPPQSSGPLRSG
ncbi:MAG: hypothetical protein U0231_07735 [Nitrospiraceae bacterium]